MRARYAKYANQLETPLRLPDGRTAIVMSDLLGPRVEQDDGSWTPAEFSYLEELPASGGRWLVQCCHDERLRPYVKSIHIERGPGAPELRNSDLLRLRNLEDVIADAWQAISRQPSIVIDNDASIPPVEPARPESKRATIRGLRRQSRSKINPEHLQQIAEVYTSNSRAPVKAIQVAFGCGESTAFRWVKLARDAGYLAPRHGQQ